MKSELELKLDKQEKAIKENLKWRDKKIKRKTFRHKYYEIVVGR